MVTRGILWMILDRKRGVFQMTHPFQAIIIQVDVGNFNFIGQAFWINTKTMILGSYFHFTCCEILDRLVATAVPEFKLIRCSAIGKSEHLVAQANSEQGHFAQQFLDILDEIPAHLRNAVEIRHHHMAK